MLYSYDIVLNYIKAACAKSNLKRCTLELGGKSPLVVFDDCGQDLDAAVKICHDILVIIISFLLV